MRRVWAKARSSDLASSMGCWRSRRLMVPMRRSTRPFCQGHPGSLCCRRIPTHHRARRRRREDRFVVGAQESWAAVVTTGRDEVAPDRQRRLIRHALHAQTRATGMVYDGQHDVLPTDSIRLHQQIHAPDQITGNRTRHAMFQCPPYTQNGVVLALERVGDVRLADGHRRRSPKRRLKQWAIVRQPASGMRALRRMISWRTYWGLGWARKPRTG